MKIIIGLGNIGKTYEKTRHNIGFMALDYYANKYNITFNEEKKFKCYLGTKVINGEKILFVKPTTYMNLSGESLILLVNYYKVSLENILIIVDDLDSAPGRIRLRANGSSGGHNGLKSIFSNLGTEEIKRIKIGIGRSKVIPVVDYVLGHISPEDEANTKRAIEITADIIDDFASSVAFNKISSKYSTK